MNYDLKVIKKKFGENMMKLSRELFPTLLEEKGLLSGIFLDNFNPSKTLYDDIKKNCLEKEYSQIAIFFFNFKTYIHFKIRLCYILNTYI